MHPLVAVSYFFVALGLFFAGLGILLWGARGILRRRARMRPGPAFASRIAAAPVPSAGLATFL
jgi:hypothetical protein